ncbi:MAG: hypothetical protein U9N63_14830 [Pseudomonadota bacterium]|nr:hypothetical protein [Pseudomonadota bacterium]
MPIKGTTDEYKAVRMVIDKYKVAKPRVEEKEQKKPRRHHEQKVKIIPKDTINDPHRYKEARCAAAEFSADFEKAAKLYAEQTGQAFKNWRDALEEIKDLLPAYRWPVPDCFAEHMIFFDPLGKGLKLEAIAVSDTLAMIKARKNGDTDTLNELMADKVALVKARNESYKLLEAEAYLEHGKRTYKNTKGKERNSALARSLGLSTGVRQGEIKARQMYKDYVELVRKKGCSRQDALEAVTSKYHLSSEDAALQHLTLELRAIRKAAKNIVKTREDGSSSGECIRDIILKHLKGLLPAKWNR